MISNRNLSITRLLILELFSTLFSQFSNTEDKAEANQKSFDLPSAIYVLNATWYISWFGNINRDFI
jgi:hypothetical protein